MCLCSGVLLLAEQNLFLKDKKFIFQMASKPVWVYRAITNIILMY